MPRSRALPVASVQPRSCVSRACAAATLTFVMSLCWQDEKIVAYKRSHLELRNLAAEVGQHAGRVAQALRSLFCWGVRVELMGHCALVCLPQLCSKLKRDAAKKDKAEAAVRVTQHSSPLRTAGTADMSLRTTAWHR